VAPSPDSLRCSEAIGRKPDSSRDLHEQLGPFYSDIGRPSIDPELLIRMLIVGCCYGIRSEEVM
jgi:transposase